MPSGLLEIGEILLAASQRRLDAISNNVSNASTPGYRKALLFEHALHDARVAAPFATTSDFAQGPLRATGRPLDLALSGAGFFQLRGPGGVYYTRAGQFESTPDGRLVDAQGRALQTADGADLILRTDDADIEILGDGVVLEDGSPIARIGVFLARNESDLQALSGTLFAAPFGSMQPAPAPVVRQGMLELSNVNVASEMLDTMRAQRSAEIGARIVQSYDTLMDQSISTFGRGRR